MINMTVRWGERYIDINFPCGDDYLTKKLLILESPGDLPTQGFVLCVNKPTELACLENKIVDLDEVNYLAKRMCSFDAKEVKQFKAALQHEGMTSVQDLINLTYNLSRYTVIQDLSSMAAIGRQHLLNLNGCMTTEQHQSIDFESVGRSLIRNNNGILTEYGLLFKNDSVPFQQEYDGQTFPYYIYEECLVTAEMQYDGKSEFLYLPCDKYAIAKAAQRLGATEDQCQIGLYDFCVDDRDWYDRLKDILDEEGIYAVNRVCAVINDANLRLGNLEAVLQYASRSDSESIALLSNHMDEFIVIPDVIEENEVAEYFLDNIYECALPEELESYLDMCDFGSYLIKQHDGRFVVGGFVCMESGCSLEQIMGPEEQTEGQTMQL